MSERLELVTDFAQLRAGMIVVGRNCHCCGASFHRGMLLGPRPRRMTGEPVFDPVPVSCIGPSGNPSVITQETVARGNLFRVIDGLEESQTTTKKRERVK